MEKGVPESKGACLGSGALCRLTCFTCLQRSHSLLKFVLLKANQAHFVGEVLGRRTTNIKYTLFKQTVDKSTPTRCTNVLDAKQQAHFSATHGRGCADPARRPPGSFWFRCCSINGSRCSGSATAMERRSLGAAHKLSHPSSLLLDTTAEWIHNQILAHFVADTWSAQFKWTQKGREQFLLHSGRYEEKGQKHVKSL